MKKKFNRKKILAMITSAMLMSNSMPAYASNWDIDGNEVSSGTEKETVITYQLDSSYMVSIPKTIALAVDTKSAEYAITVKGGISFGTKVMVVPKDDILEVEGTNFYMENQASYGLNQVIATVVQDSTNWSALEVTEEGTSKNGMISALDLTYGQWEGRLRFEISLEEDHIHHFVDGTCSGCGSLESDHTHSYVDKVTKEATCTEEGELLHECTGCDYSYTESIETISHHYVDGVCSECNEVDPNHTHNYQETIIKEATCTEEGLKQKVCSICGESKTETIPAIGHHYVDGVCSECNEKQVVYSMLRSSAGETTKSSGFLGSTSAGLEIKLDRDHLGNVYFCDYTESIGHYVTDNNCWDVSNAQDGSIIAWYKSNSAKYDVYIAPIEENIKIQAHPNSSYLFASNYTNVSYTYVIGLDKVDFSKVTNMSHMFQGTAFGEESINIDTSNVTDISYMFSQARGNAITFGDKVDFSKVTNSKSWFSGSNKKLANGYFPKGLTVIDEYAFSACSIENADIPNKITSIGEGAFRYCGLLSSVTIPDTITSIENKVFEECSRLTSVYIPNTVTSIGDNAFSGCTKLNVTIPDTVTEIGTDAFKGVSHIYYNGPATGAPWGATAIN